MPAYGSVTLDGNGNPITTANPMPVTAIGGGSSGPVNGIFISSAIPVVSASPQYSIGDCVGGKMTFNNVVSSASVGGLVQMVNVMCKSNQSASLDLILFYADPSSSTFVDNLAFSLAAADYDKSIGVAHMSDWTSLGVPSLCQADNLAKPFKSDTTSIYGVIVARSVMTLSSVSDIRLILKVLQG